MSEFITCPALLGGIKYPLPRVLYKWYTRTPGLCHSLTERTKVPGMGMEALQNSQKYQVWKSYTTHKRSGYGMEVFQSSQKFQVGIRMLCPYPGYCATGVQNFQKFRARL